MPLKPLHLISSLVAPMFVVFACGGTDSGTSTGSNSGGGGGQTQTSTGTGGGQQSTSQPSNAKCTTSCCTENDNTTASTSGTASCKTFCTVRSAAHCEHEVMDQRRCEEYFQCADQDSAPKAKDEPACVAASKVLMDCYRAQGDSCKAQTCCENQAGKVGTACELEN